MSVETRVLQGDLVRLRPLRRDDLAQRLVMVNDPEVQRLTIGVRGDENTQQDIESWFLLVQEDPFSEQWAVEDAQGRYIGDIDLHSLHVMPGEAWISPMIGDPAYRLDEAHRRDALAVITRYALDEKKVSKLCIDIPSTDTQGIEILRSLGFEQVEETELDMFSGVKTVTMAVRPETFRR